MRIRIIAVGTKMPGWVTEGFREYARRMPAEAALDLIEIPLSPRGKNTDIARAIQQEGELILGAIAPSDRVIALEVKGQNWSTTRLAGLFCDWQMEGRNLCLLIGGPDGLSDACRTRADQLWSLSALTLPHPLVRIILAEQLYRAWSITRNHPYHR